MQRGIIAGLATLCLVAGAASSAQAHRHHHRMTFGFAVLVADQYWMDRGVVVHCHPREQLLTRRETQNWGYTPDMVADRSACTIDVTPWAEAWRSDPDVAYQFCRDVVHEVGHLVGLEHNHGGVMDPTQNIVPWGCDHQRRFLRRRAQRPILSPI